MIDKSLREHYAFKILLACIAIKIGTGAVTHVCMGNFVAPITAEFGCEVSELTMFTSFNAIAMALLYTTAAKILTTKRIGLVMGFASLVEMSGVAMMSTFRNVFVFRFAGALIGGANAFTGLIAIPLIINMWFHKKTGTILGLVIAIGNAATVLYNLLSAQFITSFGWRNAYLILAGMGLVLTVPAIFLFVKSPQEAGCLPYGAGEVEPTLETPEPSGSEWGLTKKEAFRMPMLYVAWIACIFISYGSAVAGYVTPFTTMELGQTINFGARVGVAMSLGGILGSVIVGRINDRFGVKAGFTWGAVTTTAGYAMMFLTYGNPMLAYVGSFILGLGNCMYMVQCPLLARSVVGSKYYSEIWAVMMVANSLIGGGLYSSVGLFYDRLGSYQGAFIMGAGLYIAAALIGFAAINMSKRHQQCAGKEAA